MGKKSSKITPIILSKYLKPSFVISKSNFSLVWFGATNQFLVVQDALEVFFTASLVQTESEYQEALEELVGIHPEILDIMEAISIDNTNSLAKDAPAADYRSLLLQDFEVSSLALGQHTVSVYYGSKTLQTVFEAPFNLFWAFEVDSAFLRADGNDQIS